MVTVRRWRSTRRRSRNDDGRPGGGGGEVRKPYNLTVGINVQNLFNNVNFSKPGELAHIAFVRADSDRRGGDGPRFSGSSAAVEVRLIDESICR